MAHTDDVDDGTARASATRIDAATGIEEVAAFFGQGPVFGVRHVPTGPVRAGVVMCSSIYGDEIPLYRREVLVARALAARGVAVQRFHYRGFKHSGDVQGGATFASMVDDARAAAAHLETFTGARCRAVIAPRFGALVAAAFAAGDPDMGLVLWEPAAKASTFYREAVRANLARGTAGGGGEPISSKEFAERIEADGAVDLLGYTLERGLHESSVELKLAEVLGDAPRSVLIVQLDDQPGDPARIADQWRSAGWDVVLLALPSRDVWWFLDERAMPAEALIDATVGWVEHLTADVGA